jgi:hypothetical protein
MWKNSGGDDMNETRIIKLIYTQMRVGSGVADDPVRLMDQLWTIDGMLIAQYDPSGDESFFKGYPYGSLLGCQAE